MKTRLKNLLLRALSRLTGRHAVLLPAAARTEDETVAIDGPYRVEGDRLSVALLDPRPGKLAATLFGYQGHFPTRQLWHADHLAYPGPCRLTVRLSDGQVELAGVVQGPPAAALIGRRLSWRLQFTTATGEVSTRDTGHYLAGGGATVGESYFQGDNYVDHEQEAAGETRQILKLLKEHGALGPLLEVGCATGAVLAALSETAIEGWGVDISAWAIEQAQKRLNPTPRGEQRAFVCNAETEPLPPAVAPPAPSTPSSCGPSSSTSPNRTKCYAGSASTPPPGLCW